MRTASGSWRWVTNLPWPGRRLSRKAWICSAVRAIPGGQPSTTQPRAGPWLSPQVVTRNRWPKVLCDMGGGVAERETVGKGRRGDHLPPTDRFAVVFPQRGKRVLCEASAPQGGGQTAKPRWGQVSELLAPLPRRVGQ